MKYELCGLCQEILRYLIVERTNYICNSKRFLLNFLELIFFVENMIIFRVFYAKFTKKNLKTNFRIFGKNVN